MKSAPTFWIAYSGGVDSHVLLHLFSKCYPSGDRIKAIHVNHGLSKNASAWEIHCKQTSEALGISCDIVRVNVNPKKGESTEARARDARYAAFAHLLDKEDYLVTAHHEDDQAETVLLQLFRGAGVKGLSAMPVLSPFAKGYHFRPFLNFKREEILAYAKEHHLQWIEDESNLNQQFDRNYVRQTVMPMLCQRWPAVASTLARSAKMCAQAESLLTERAKEDLKKVRTKRRKTLSITSLLKLTDARQKNVLRYWLHEQSFCLPQEVQMEHLLKDVLHCAEDACPLVCWEGVEIRRYRDELYAMAPQAPSNENVMTPSHIKRLLVSSYQKGLKQLTQEEVSNITVRFRKGGEKIHPAGRRETHELKKLFQEWGVPPWERESIPLIYLKEELICVVGFCIAESYWVNQD